MGAPTLKLLIFMLNKTNFFILFLSLFLSSCEFRPPSLAEQQVLLKKGAFPGGIPPWVATPRAGISSVADSPRSDGIFRKGFTKEAGAQEDQGILARKYEQIQVAELKKAEVANAPDQQKKFAVAKSPLDRILADCPDVEKEVTTALQTLDLQQRIKKYESLVNRCPESWDLWFWLGQDYEKNKQLVQAGRCYDKVLVINPNNEEAEKLATANRKFLNSRPTK